MIIALYIIGISLLIFSLAKFYGRGFERKYQTGETIRFKGEMREHFREQGKIAG